MQQTLFIVILAVAIAFVLAYRWKKKAENKMDNMSLNYKSKQQIFFLTKAYYISNKILSTCDKYIKPTKGKILFIMMFVGLSQCTGMGFIESVKSGQIGTILRIIYHHFL